MARKVYFSFHFQRDSWRVANVRNSGAIRGLEKTPFYDAAQWEAIRRQGDQAIRRWIESELAGTSVTVVLVGAQTAGRRWVKYEIRRSRELGKGLLGIDISSIRDRHGHSDRRGANPLPRGYPLYDWARQDGRANIGLWIDAAARAAGR